MRGGESATAACALLPCVPRVHALGRFASRRACAGTHAPTTCRAAPTRCQAAAVGNRLEVAALLLQEAGAAARALALATNRYGQSAWQIAARKGAADMMQLLAMAAA